MFIFRIVIQKNGNKCREENMKTLLLEVELDSVKEGERLDNDNQKIRIGHLYSGQKIQVVSFGQTFLISNNRGTNFSWFGLKHQTGNGEVVLKFGDSQSTRIDQFKQFFLKIKNRNGVLLSLYAFYCFENMSLRSFWLLSVTQFGVLKNWFEHEEFVQSLKIPSTIMSDIRDVLRDVSQQVKVKIGEDDGIFLSQNNCDIVDVWFNTIVI